MNLQANHGLKMRLLSLRQLAGDKGRKAPYGDKHKQEPMEAHFYGTDYKYNAFSGEATDNSREITKEEFFGKK